MANKVLLKKSSVAAKIPLSTDLDYGELALNYADGKLYFKNSSNAIQSFTNDSSLVTLTGTQTLTNKTLTSPTLTGGTINNTIIGGSTPAAGSFTTLTASSTITASGIVSGSELTSTLASGDEGGQINLAKPPNATIAAGVTIDVWQNRLRFFVQGGDARGAYIDLSAASAGVGTNLISTSGGGTLTSITAGTGLTGGTITTSGTIAIDTSVVATLTGTQTLTNKTHDNTNSYVTKSSLFTLQDATDTTKQAVFSLSGITTATTRTYTLPNASTTLIGAAGGTFSGGVTFSSATNYFGNSTATGTTELASGATVSASTKTVNIGTGGLTGSTTTMAIGSTFGTTVTANGTWTYSTPLANSNLANSAITINGTSISLGSSGSITTTAITEGTNLYYTDARARAAQSAGTGISYNSTTGVISTVQDIATTASPTFAGLSTTGTLTVGGDLVVNGTTTTVNSTTITVDDKNIELGSVATPTDITANGGGITLKGSTDKTFNWVSSTASWTSSENLDLASGKTFKINGSDVLTSSQVLGKTLPSGTVVGTTDSQTLTNKTLTSPTINNATVNNLIITGTLTAGGGVGTAGQILQSTGTGVEWTSAAGSDPADIMYFNILSRVGEVQAKLTSLLQNYLDFDNQTFRTPVGFVDTRTQTINVTG